MPQGIPVRCSGHAVPPRHCRVSRLHGIQHQGCRPRGCSFYRNFRIARYPGLLVIQDVLTLHGSQFKDAAIIVASPPCQAYSYRAMPWKKAKALPPPDNTLFEACFRIQREACEAAGRHIPMIVENVRGAQPWVGRARWNFGSYYLWGDVPALMPITFKGSSGFKGIPHRTTGHWTNPAEGRKGAGAGAGAAWFDGNLCKLPSSLPRRKFASAMIAKIPPPLSRHIAAVFNPTKKAPS
jgi:hypothetical protein